MVLSCQTFLLFRRDHTIHAKVDIGCNRLHMNVQVITVKDLPICTIENVRVNALYSYR